MVYIAPRLGSPPHLEFWPISWRLDLGLLGIVDVNAQVPDGALQLAVSEQQLYRPQVFRSAINQRCLSPAHGVSAVCRRIQSDGLDPPPDHPSILPRGKVRRAVQATGEKIVVTTESCLADPARDRLPGLLSNLELNRTLRLSLHDHRPGSDASPLADIADAQTDQVTRPQLAVDGEIEKCQFTDVLSELKSNSDRPDFALLERWLLPDQFSLVPGHPAR